MVNQIDNPMVNTSTTTSTSTEVTNYKVHVRLDPKDTKTGESDRPKAFPFPPRNERQRRYPDQTHGSVIAVPINAVTTRDKSDTSSREPARLLAGWSCRLPVVGWWRRKKVVVEDLQEVVFIMQPGGTVKRVNVKTDIQDINYIEIKEGSKKGMRSSRDRIL